MHAAPDPAADRGREDVAGDPEQPGGGRAVARVREPAAREPRLGERLRRQLERGGGVAGAAEVEPVDPRRMAVVDRAERAGVAVGQPEQLAIGAGVGDAVVGHLDPRAVGLTVHGRPGSLRYSARAGTGWNLAHRGGRPLGRHRVSAMLTPSRRDLPPPRTRTAHPIRPGGHPTRAPVSALPATINLPATLPALLARGHREGWIGPVPRRPHLDHARAVADPVGLRRGGRERRRPGWPPRSAPRSASWSRGRRAPASPPRSSPRRGQTSSSSPWTCG